MLKRLTLFISLVVVLTAAGLYLSEPSRAPHFSDSITFVQNLVQELPKQENLPEPLSKRTRDGQFGGEETLAGRAIVRLTNAERAQAGLPALTENRLLDRAAEAKMDDMFNLQYFEHKSPTGLGPSDIITKAGYEYILVGENLAEGDFVSNADLIQGWMNSPGHRANILHPKYTEIGVAARRGSYEGRQVWMAVQEFGRPLSDCPRVDENIKVAIAAGETQVKTLQVELERRSTEMAIAQEQGDREKYNALVPPYNELVAKVNALVAETKGLVSRYNAQVQKFNACIA